MNNKPLNVECINLIVKETLPEFTGTIAALGWL
jgi:hypothetical protein